MSKKRKLEQVFFHASVNNGNAQYSAVFTIKRGADMVDIFKHIRKKVAKHYKQHKRVVMITAMTIRKVKLK